MDQMWRNEIDSIQTWQEYNINNFFWQVTSVEKMVVREYKRHFLVRPLPTLTFPKGQNSINNFMFLIRPLTLGW